MKKLKSVLLFFLLISEGSVFGDSSVFNRIYFGAGTGYEFSEDNVSTSDGKNDSKNIDHFNGTLIFGSGRVANANPLYLGGEILFDIAKTQHTTFNNVRVRSNGIIPSFAFVIGYPVSDSNWLFFFKIGCNHTKEVLASGSSGFIVSKISPIIAFGIETSYSKSCRLRLEAEHQLKTERSNEYYKLERRPGVKVRLILLYTFNF